jgi:hypothetical protein
MRKHDLLDSLLANAERMSQGKTPGQDALHPGRPGDLESLLNLAQTLEHVLRPVAAPTFTDRLYRQLLDPRADDLIIAFPGRPWRLFLFGAAALLAAAALAVWAARRFRNGGQSG